MEVKKQETTPVRKTEQTKTETRNQNERPRIQLAGPVARAAWAGQPLAEMPRPGLASMAAAVGNSALTALLDDSSAPPLLTSFQIPREAARMTPCPVPDDAPVLADAGGAAESSFSQGAAFDPACLAV